MRIWERFCEAFNIEFEEGLPMGPPTVKAPSPPPMPVGRSAAEDHIEQLEDRIEHMAETVTELRHERDELHRLVIEGDGGKAVGELLVRLHHQANSIEALTEQVGELQRQRDLARTEARRYASRLSGLATR